MKKITAILLAMALVASIASVSALAADESQPADRTQRVQRGEGFGGRKENDGRGRNDGRGGSGSGRMVGFGANTEEIEAAISELDEAVKTEIDALLEKYSQACDAAAAAIENKAEKTELDELQKTAREAWTALSEALKEAGVEMGRSETGRGPMERADEKPFDGKGFGRMFDAESVKQAIAALEDETLKAELTELVEAWEAACQSQQAAFDKDSEPDEDERKQLMEEVRAAYQALAESLEEAGIEAVSDRPERGERTDAPKRKDATDKAEKGDEPAEKPVEQKSEVESADSAKSEKGGFFGWLSRLFG